MTPINLSEGLVTNVNLEDLMVAAKKFGLDRTWGVSQRERILEERRDTVAKQWLGVYEKQEQISRSCLYCEFVAKSRVSLKTHLRYKHQIGNQ